MRSILLILFSFCMVSISCKEYVPDHEPATGECRLKFTLRAEEAEQTAGRSLSGTAEAAVHDLNIYAVDLNRGIVRHSYVEGTLEPFMILPTGKWELYAYANLGADLGDQTITSLLELRMSVAGEISFSGNGCLPMSAKKSVTLDKNTASVSMILERLAAKLNVSIKTSPDMTGRVRINTMQVLNVPAWIPLTDQKASDEMIDYPSTFVTGIPYSKSLYIGENRAGVNNAIDDSRKRNPSNAPNNATCLRLSGVFDDGSRVYYYVYPGGNQTSDFNVLRNRNYTMKITIYGKGENDLRAAIHDLTLSDSQISCAKGETAYTDLTLTADNNIDNIFSITFYVVSGNPIVTIDGITTPPSTFASGISGEHIAKTFRIGITQLKAGSASVGFSLNNSFGQPIMRTLTVNFK